MFCDSGTNYPTPPTYRSSWERCSDVIFVLHDRVFFCLFRAVTTCTVRLILLPSLVTGRIRVCPGRGVFASASSEQDQGFSAHGLVSGGEGSAQVRPSSVPAIAPRLHLLRKLCPGILVQVWRTCYYIFILYIYCMYI